VIAGLIVAGALLLGSLSAVVSRASDGTTSRAARSFPMWKLLPTKSFATLMDQTVGNLRIGIYVYGRGGASAPRRVCIQQTVVRDAGPIISASTGNPECSTMYPNRGFAATLGGFKQNQITAIGLVTGQEATSRVEVEMVPGGVVGRQSKVLSARQARKAHVVPLRYVALTIPAVGCLESIKGLSSAGEVLFGTGARGCAAA